ncbi:MULTISPECIES: hypothetical protein [Sphingomonas]|uniref:terminase small subunit-like protein n=1 Tax=Sphingomonas TaxID=13687 RepID=UPI000F7ECD1A|nr:hypothetical protein [Sphingomonas sp. ABOLF]RSV14624.1 hypothetical protein CA235_11130 [Sphingomonas sp. ABOLF]GLK19224.1 hypothetical protein GCM10017606_00500 [Microbacterium terregens]
MATKRAQEIDEGGKFLPMVSDEQWDEVLERIANGEIAAHVMKSLGLHKSTLTAKCRRDPGFNERYKDALEDHYVSIAEDLRMVTRGVPGYSTGDVRRDELVAKYDLALARSFANKVLGERVQVDQTVSVAPVMLPAIALHVPEIEDATDSDNDPDPS